MKTEGERRLGDRKRERGISVHALSEQQLAVIGELIKGFISQHAKSI